MARELLHPKTWHPALNYRLGGVLLIRKKEVRFGGDGEILGIDSFDSRELTVDVAQGCSQAPVIIGCVLANSVG